MQLPFIRALLFWIMVLPCILRAQGVTITGRIVDAETLEALPYAHVFIDETTIGAVSDINGEYILEHIQNGAYKLVFSFVGYELYFKTIEVTNADLRISARLIPDEELLQSVEVQSSRDKEWERQLKKFNTIFFGERDLAKGCNILNPWVLDFTYDKSLKLFKATASSPLQIENKSLGYQIECTLQAFSADSKGYKIKGLYKFEEINTLDSKEAARWTRNRRQAYQTSLRFLFKSMIDQHGSENGFVLYSDKRPTSYTSTSGYFAHDLGKHVFELDTKNLVLPTGRPGFYQISLEDKMEVHHTTLFSNNKFYRDVPYPISWVEFENGKIVVSQDGQAIGSEEIITSGQFNGNRVAAMLPRNYSPGSMLVVNYITKRKIAQRLQERAYVTTDKGFYYAGEKMWLNVFTNYANQSVRDSLSRVVYTDVIGPSQKILKSKIFKLDSAMAMGSFALDPAWPPGVYHLRAYTSWMMNYGPEIFFYRPFAIMESHHKLLTTTLGQEKNDFEFILDKPISQPLGQMHLKVLLDSVNNDFSANCSMAISLAAQAVFPGSADIKQTLFFPEEMPAGTLSDFVFPLEYGFSLKGRLTRPKKKHTSAEMSVIQGNMDSLYHFSTNHKGNFEIEGLSFYDTVRFSFQGKNKKGRIFGITELLGRQPPDVDAPKPNLRVIDTLLLSTPIVFKKIVVKDSLEVRKGESSNENREVSTSSSNALIITGEQLRATGGSQNIVDALVGRVPGFFINPTTGKAGFRGIVGGAGESKEALFLVDGVPVNTPSEPNTKLVQQGASEATRQESKQRPSEGSNQAQATASAYDNQQNQTSSEQQTTSTASMLGYLSLENVNHVEINSRMDPRYGPMGNNGVIAIFTKKAQGKSKYVKTFDVFTVEGFAPPEKFTAIDTLNMPLHTAYSPTVYWNPFVRISAYHATDISFQAPAKPGEYLVRVEGTSGEGKPLSGTFMFSVVPEKKNSGLPSPK